MIIRIVLALTLACSLLGFVACQDSAKADGPKPPDPRDQQIQELKTRLAQLESKPKEHHYELRQEGLRTFRFNPETGDTCIQLTTPQDWKKADTIRQSCTYVDYAAEGHSWADTQCSFFLKYCDLASWNKEVK